jgi:hypothetical protein
MRPLVMFALVLGAMPAQAAKKRPSAPSAARALHVRAVDLGKRTITVELIGFAKPPAANLFSLTDERDRHVVAQTIACEEPVDGVRSCALEIPAGYERHRIVDVLVRVGGLKGRPLHAPASEVQAAWEAASGGGAAPATAGEGER